MKTHCISLGIKSLQVQNSKHSLLPPGIVGGKKVNFHCKAICNFFQKLQLNIVLGFAFFYSPEMAQSIDSSSMLCLTKANEKLAFVTRGKAILNRTALNPTAYKPLHFWAIG